MEFTQFTVRTGWGRKATKVTGTRQFTFQAESPLEAAIRSANEFDLVALRIRQRTGRLLTQKTKVFLEGLVFCAELV